VRNSDVWQIQELVASKRATGEKAEARDLPNVGGGRWCEGQFSRDILAWEWVTVKEINYHDT
jgi:hypothetical protein